MVDTSLDGYQLPTRYAEELDPPDLEYLQELEKRLTEAYSDDDNRIKRLRAVRELKNEIKLPKKLVDIQVHDPTVTDEIARVASMLGSKPPKLTVKPLDPSDTAEENSTRREKFSEAVLEAAGSRQPGHTAFELLVDAVVGDGGGVVKFQFNKDIWDYRYSIDANDAKFQIAFDEDEHDESEEDEQNEEDSDESLDVADVAEFLGDLESDEGGETSETPKKKNTITDWAQFNKLTESAKRAAGPPFELTHVDILTWYPVYQGRRIGEVLEVSERPTSSTFRQYRLERDDAGNIRKRPDIVPQELGQPQPRGSARSAGGVVKFLEHHDAVWSTYAIVGHNNSGSMTGEILQQWKHGYNRVPYFFVPGIWFNYFKNRKCGWSISESKRWLVEYRSFLFTLHAQVAARDTYTPLFRKVAPGPAGVGNNQAPKKDETWDLSVIYEGKPGEELKPIEFPDVARALREEIAIVSEAIEKLESPRIKADIGGGVEGAGFAIQSLLAEARTRFAPIQQSIERGLKDITRFMWYLIRERVKEDVWVCDNSADSESAGWMHMGPDDLADMTSLEWHLDPEQASAKLIEARYWHERLKAGTASKDMAVTALGDNPDVVRFEQTMDELRSSPWYQDFLQRHILSKANRGDLLKQAQMAEQMAQTGGVPGPGQPPMPPPGGGPPAVGAPGGGPDQGNMALVAGGRGAAPSGPGAPPGPSAGPPGGVSGAGAGAVVPSRGAAAGIQRM